MNKSTVGGWYQSRNKKLDLLRFKICKWFFYFGNKIAPPDLFDNYTTDGIEPTHTMFLDNLIEHTDKFIALLRATQTSGDKLEVDTENFNLKIKAKK